MELKSEVYKFLIRSDGKLNSPLLKNKKFKYIIGEIYKTTDFLKNSSLSQRWQHIKNDITAISNCVVCDKHAIFNGTEYSKYCSQYCAVTSDEARIRTSKQFKGIKQNFEHKSKSALSRTGLKRNDVTKEKIKKAQLGEKNSMYGKKPWNFGLYGIRNPMYGKKRPGTGLKGNKNPMYGKSPSPYCGRGISGKFNNIHFRSSLELMYLIYWDYNNITVESAETSKFRTIYEYSPGDLRHYTPDYYLPDLKKLYEIKPEYAQNNKIVLKKFQSLLNANPNIKCIMSGYNEIDKFISDIINNGYFKKLLNNNIKLTNKQLNRLLKNYPGLNNES